MEEAIVDYYFITFIQPPLSEYRLLHERGMLHSSAAAASSILDVQALSSPTLSKSTTVELYAKQMCADLLCHLRVDPLD